MPAHSDNAGEADWLLFTDWCTAAGADPLTAGPDSIRAFLASLSTSRATADRRVRNIRAHRRRRGTPDPFPPTAVDRTDLVAAAGQVLGASVVQGWPGGARGRRDALIVVLRGHLGLTRSQVRQITPLDLSAAPGRVWASGFRLNTTTGPGPCPACGLTRWLRLLSLAERKGWTAVRAAMAGKWPESADQQVGHDCSRMLQPGWQQAPVLIPAMDRHGWVDDHGSLSIRSISAVPTVPPALAVCEVQPETPPDVPSPVRPVWDRARQAAEFAEMDPLFDRLEREIDAALERSRHLLGQD